MKAAAAAAAAAALAPLTLAVALFAAAATATAIAAAAPASHADVAFDPVDFAFRPHPGAQLPLAVKFTDERARPVALGQFFTTGVPVILVLDYLRCRTLCGVTLHNIIGALAALPLVAGRDFQLVAISIDPRDTPADAAAAEAKYLALYDHPPHPALSPRRGEGSPPTDGRPMAQGGGPSGVRGPPGSATGVHFLTWAGAAPASVRRIADVVGFPYRYDPALDQYIHPAGFVLATPDGHISRYVLGVGAAAPEQLQRAIADAEQDKAIGPLTHILLLCHIAGIPPGRFTVPVLAALMSANIAAGLALIAIFAAIRRRRG